MAFWFSPDDAFECYSVSLHFQPHILASVPSKATVMQSRSRWVMKFCEVVLEVSILGMFWPILENSKCTQVGQLTCLKLATCSEYMLTCFCLWSFTATQWHLCVLYAPRVQSALTQPRALWHVPQVTLHLRAQITAPDVTTTRSVTRWTQTACRVLQGRPAVIRRWTLMIAPMGSMRW